MLCYLTHVRCSYAHASNFGFYASPQRTIVFDLNDFDEAAFAPWEWDLKRLTASVVVAGHAAGQHQHTVEKAVVGLVTAFARSLRFALSVDPATRFSLTLDPKERLKHVDPASQKMVDTAVAQAIRRAEKRAVRRLTSADAGGRLRFVSQPPSMTPLSPEREQQAREGLRQYLASTETSVQQLMSHYSVADVARRVVGVGSVGTRCELAALQDGDGNALVMQTKQAVRSVLEEYGGIEQPAPLKEMVNEKGEGARVVALQRTLQAVSDPFLGHTKTADVDLYVRQFHDMKGGMDIGELEPGPFRDYAGACAVTLARAHSQSLQAAVISGYIGDGKELAHALLEWAHHYSDQTAQDLAQMLASESADAEIQDHA